MSSSGAQARPVLVFYHIPGDGDEAEMPNAFPVLLPEGKIMLKDVRSKFPLPGTYHFRFKMRWGPEPLQVAWMDVTNESAAVPYFDGKVVAKVVRVSWDAQAAPSANGTAKAPAAAKAADVLSFDSPAVTPAAPPAQAPKDDFDMLFS
ncbi:unnamed protein product [Effrenium voratum]|uniref:DIX domain-containing protein n=1 Tax=Effrenium voratum TaxID=2562239 RepID=A0AA36NML5_9DINO|nr:unnamed protein product [Effrenium voratum]CAJ1422952.1 unnamed protein product [Effrenium voratum]|mmetsp:Transcript_68624/g.163451  ORF Transcript_68624/g.163451 Transcript_68624/m.163451 type:complete len:148 (+) Transcript_68624:105-548(+)